MRQRFPPFPSFQRAQYPAAIKSSQFGKIKSIREIPYMNRSSARTPCSRLQMAGFRANRQHSDLRHASSLNSESTFVGSACDAHVKSTKQKNSRDESPLARD
jgi:hypothetical protein